LSLNSDIVGTGSLLTYDNLYLLDNVVAYSGSFNAESCGTKRKIDNNNSGALWHKRLGHISKSGVERLVSNGILDSTDFKNGCVECIKGKHKKK